MIPLQMLLAALLGWLEREQRDVDPAARPQAIDDDLARDRTAPRALFTGSPESVTRVLSAMP